MEDLNRYVPNVYFEKIPIKNLVSNQDYQRNLSQAHIIKVAENFDVFQINPVKVSRRDGINYVFNGQHTIEIVALVSGSRETPVWCMIYDELNYSHEADIFANQMKYVKPLQPLEVFNANLEAGNPDQLMIRDLVESYGLTIGNKQIYGEISAISTIENIYLKYGYHILNRVLFLILATWEGDKHSFSANMLKAVCKLCIIYKDQINEEEFKEKVGSYSVKQISRIAKERRKGHMGFAEAMVMAYNGKKKTPANRLPEKKLYTHEIAFGIYADEDDADTDDYDRQVDSLFSEE